MLCKQVLIAGLDQASLCPLFPVSAGNSLSGQEPESGMPWASQKTKYYCSARKEHGHEMTPNESCLNMFKPVCAITVSVSLAAHQSCCVG